MNVVVGYDGSDFAMQALDWAMDEAELRKATLLVAHTWSWPYGDADAEAKVHLRKAAEHVLWHGADCARATSSLVRIETDLHEGHAAQRLVELSAGADLVVVGSRGLSRLPSAMLGSVATYVAEHAECPVIVVRGPGPIPASARPGPIAVEEASGGVLAFAFSEAELRGLPLAGRIPAVWRERYPDVDVAEGKASLLVVGREHARHVLRDSPCPVAVVAD